MPLRIKLLLTKCDTAWEGLGAYLAFIQEPERLSSVKEKAELPHTLAEPSSSPPCQRPISFRIKYSLSMALPDLGL